MEAVNLIPKSRMEAGHRRSRLRRWAVVCGAYAAFLVLTLIVARFIESGDERSARRQLEDAATAAEASRGAVALLRGTLADFNLQRQRNLAVGVQPDWSLVLAELSRRLGDEIVLQQCRFGGDLEPRSAPGRPTRTRDRRPEPDLEETLHMELAGFGRGQASVAEFLLRLEASGMFASVKPLDTQREPFGTDFAVAFRIECILDTEEMQAQEDPAS